VVLPWPFLVEFIIPTGLTFLTFSLLALSWLRPSRRPLSSVSLFAIGCLSLLYFATADPYLWFGSIALWELIILVILFESMHRLNFRSGLLVFLILIAAVTLSDDGKIFYSIITLLLMQVFFLKNGRRQHAAWIAMSTLVVVTYNAIIGFVGASYYGSYLPFLESEIAAFLSLNIHSVAQQLNYFSLPLYRVIPLDIAFLVLFVLLPLLLLVQHRKYGITLKNLAIPGALLSSGLALRVTSIVYGQSLYVTSFFVLILYLFLPISVFGLVRATFLTQQIHVTSRNHNHSVAMVGIVFGCVLVLSVLGQILPLGPIVYAQDPRVDYVTIPASGVFAQTYALTPLATEPIADLTTIFVSPAPISNYLLASPLHSIYSKPPILSQRDIYYTNGPIVIVNR
jgi:hypothetical protein